MAAPTKPTPTPVLENFYNLKKACEQLGLSDPEDPEDKTGQKWLRDGVNREINPFPCTPMAGRLMFSDSHLIAITRMAAEEKIRRGPPRPISATRRASNARRRKATQQNADAEARDTNAA